MKNHNLLNNYFVNKKSNNSLVVVFMAASEAIGVTSAVKPSLSLSLFARALEANVTCNVVL